MQQVQFDQAFMFAYSMREKTHAHRKMDDNVPQTTKQERLQEIIQTFRTTVQQRNESVEIGRLRLVLLEGPSKKNKGVDATTNTTWSGRTDQNKRIVFPYHDCINHEDIFRVGHTPPLPPPLVAARAGDYGVVQVTEARGHTLRGNLLWRTTLKGFAEIQHRETELKELFSQKEQQQQQWQ